MVISLSITRRCLLISAISLLFIAISSADISAAPALGVNYYGESLMGSSGLAYTQRTSAEIASDLDHIHQISNNVKLYMNPFVDQNLAWIQNILRVANDRDMYTVVNMAVDNRYLTPANWDEYSSRVKNACAALSGQTDEILVGNEIILRSSMSATEIKNRVVILINECKRVFSGEVSYEEFWWEHAVWNGYPGKIYLMQYEGLSDFQRHTQIMDQMFGANAIVGEWGEDLIDESIERDENWQRDQIERRYNMLAQTRTPVAYIFAYSEPSWNAFGIVRPDGNERPVWAYLKSLGFGKNSVPTPTNSIDVTLKVAPWYPQGNNYVLVCESAGFSPTSYDFVFGDGQQVKNYDKNNVYHTYSNGNFQASCVAKSGTQQKVGTLNLVIGTPSVTPPPSGCFNSLNDLPASCSGTITSDLKDGSRKVVCDSSDGSVEVEAWEKTDSVGKYFEIYQRRTSGVPPKLCLGSDCLQSGWGYAVGKHFPICAEPPVVNTGCFDNLQAIPAKCEGGTITRDESIYSGTCRQIICASGSASMQVLACDKESAYEMYIQSGSGLKVCVGKACVGDSGFARENYVKCG